MQNTTPLQTLKYSAFLGAIFASDALTETAINNAVIAVGGDTIRKKGYTGTNPEGPSAKALAILRENGVTPTVMRGPLTSVKIAERIVNGAQANYLNVTVGTSAGKQFLSIEMTSKAAQDLVRRLTDATPGADTEIKLYGRFGQREGANRAYADHYASVKQDGKDLRGTNPADMWTPINAAQAPLKAAGITDKAILRSVQDKETVKWHLALIPAIKARISAHYDQRAATGFTTAPAAATAAPAQPDCTVYVNNSCGTGEQCTEAGRCLAATDFYPLPGETLSGESAPAAAGADDDDPFGLNEPQDVSPPAVVTPIQEKRVIDPFTL